MNSLDPSLRLLIELTVFNYLHFIDPMLTQFSNLIDQYALSKFWL